MTLVAHAHSAFQTSFRPKVKDPSKLSVYASSFNSHSLESYNRQAIGREPFKESSSLIGIYLRKKEEKKRERNSERVESHPYKQPVPKEKGSSVTFASPLIVTRLDVQDSSKGVRYEVPRPATLPVQVPDVAKDLEERASMAETGLSECTVPAGRTVRERLSAAGTAIRQQRSFIQDLRSQLEAKHKEADKNHTKFVQAATLSNNRLGLIQKLKEDMKRLQTQNSQFIERNLMLTDELNTLKKILKKNKEKVMEYEEKCLLTEKRMKSEENDQEKRMLQLQGQVQRLRAGLEHKEKEVASFVQKTRLSITAELNKLSHQAKEAVQRVKSAEGLAKQLYLAVEKTVLVWYQQASERRKLLLASKGTLIAENPNLFTVTNSAESIVSTLQKCIRRKSNFVEELADYLMKFLLNPLDPKIN